MPSVFDIFGSINLETRAFDGSLQSVVGKLKNADSALDSTIAKSNKLGDTSATVARRYEKLAEGIQAQRNKLLDNALAFERGEISAKKYASVQASVEKATEGLSSRLKDAKARLVELDQTGLTHFQQQIATAVDNANSKLESFRQKILATQGGSGRGVDLIRDLSGYQKTQLSFQANDIITGLLSGQNPLQIAAQQGGQVFQILQQTKAAQEGVATAATAAAASQAAFTASSAAAVAPQAAVATSAAATAASTEAAAAAMTVLGIPLVAAGAVIATIVVDLLAIYKATRDIEAAAKARLDTEIAITAALNKQRLEQQAFLKERKDAQTGREFDRFLGSAGSAYLEQGKAEREAELKKLLQEVERTTLTNAAALSAVGGFKDKDKRDAFLAQGINPATVSRIDQLREELKDLDKALDETKAKITSTVTGYSGIIDVAMAHAAAVREADAKNAVEKAKQVEKAKKELIDESIKKAKEFAERVKNAPSVIAGVLANTTDNPFTKIFLEGETAVNRMLEATKGLGAELQNNLRKLIESDVATKSFKQSLDNALNASNLRNEARQFLQGYADGDAEAIKKRAQRELFPNYSSAAAYQSALQAKIKEITQRDYTANIARQLNAVGTFNTAGLNSAQLAELDKKTIAITQGADPSKLDFRTAKAAADARLREADRDENEKEEDKQIRKDTRDYLQKLLAGKALEIEITDKQGLTNGATTATPQTTKVRYKN